MIMLTRLSGSQFVLNSDLIERVDATPDTVVTLADGTKYVVAESLSEVTAAVLRYRSQIVALSGQIGQDPGQAAAPPAGHLAPVTSLANHHREAPTASEEQEQ